MEPAIKLENPMIDSLDYVEDIVIKEEAPEEEEYANECEDFFQEFNATDAVSEDKSMSQCVNGIGVKIKEEFSYQFDNFENEKGILPHNVEQTIKEEKHNNFALYEAAEDQVLYKNLPFSLFNEDDDKLEKYKFTKFLSKNDKNSKNDSCKAMENHKNCNYYLRKQNNIPLPKLQNNEKKVVNSKSSKLKKSSNPTVEEKSKKKDALIQSDKQNSKNNDLKFKPTESANSEIVQESLSPAETKLTEKEIKYYISVVLKLKTDKESEIFYCCCCSYESKKLALLKRHLCSHLKIKRYKCTECDYEANFKSYLREHSVVHSDLRAFQCSYCNFASKLKSNLKKHEKIHIEKNKRENSFVHSD